VLGGGGPISVFSLVFLGKLHKHSYIPGRKKEIECDLVDFGGGNICITMLNVEAGAKNQMHF
jgi:hypothetical protein